MNDICATCLWLFVCPNEDLEACEDTGVCEDFLDDDFLENKV